MNDDRWTVVDRLLGAALEREPHERAAFLREVCGEDEALRRDVESLLRHAASGAGLLSTSALAGGMPSGQDSVVGRRIGSYTIQAPLGVGGMGEVYRARDSTLGRDVALKILPRAVSADPDRRARFDREARLLAALNHPHIGAIYGVEDSDGVRALVLELVDGDTLAERIARGPLPINEVLTIGRQIADALDAAHEKGITHRDLKPANIKITPTGVVKVLDFGLAKATSIEGSGPELPQAEAIRVDGTREGMILGTAAYMSPEQARGKATDKRSDVWAFGCVVYEMLTGRLAFRGDTVADTIAGILHKEPEWSALPDATPAPVRRLLLRCLDKDAKRRLRDIGDARAELDEVLSSVSLARATPAIAPTSVTPTISRRSYGRRAVAVVAAAVIFLIGSTVVWQPREDGNFWLTQLSSGRPATNFEGDAGDPAVSPDGKTVVFLAAGLGEPFNVWVMQTGISERFNLTNGTFRTPTPVGAAIRRVGFIDDGQIWISEGRGKGPYPLWKAPLRGELSVFLDDAMEPAWSPDGSQMAYHTADGDPIYVADRNGLNPKLILAAERGVHRHHLTWSPDGRFLYFVMGNPTTDETDIFRIPIPASPGVVPEQMTTRNEKVKYLAWLDDRTLIFSGSADDGSGQWLYTLDVDERIPRRASSGITEQYLSVSASHTSPRRVIASVATIVGADLWTVPAVEGQSATDVREFPVATQRRITNPRVAGNDLYYLSSTDGRNGLYRLKDGKETELWSGRDGGIVAAPAISPRGTQICITIRDQGKSRLYVMNADGTNKRPVKMAFDVRGTASWSNDDQWIAVAANNGKGTYIYKIPVGGGDPVPLTDTASYNPLWSPADELIVYSVPGEGSKFLSKAVTPHGVTVRIPEIETFYLVSTPYRFTPDGKSLIFLKEETVEGVMNFYTVHLETEVVQPITRLEAGVQTGSFDVMDGTIIFDRVRQNSTLVHFCVEARPGFWTTVVQRLGYRPHRAGC